MLTLPKTKQLTRIAALTAAILATGCGQQDEETSESKSICGRTNDLQEVPEYDGTLGISIGFVAQHETPVGAILNAGGSPYCSGTLISENLFLTAGHCIPSGPDSVAFNYQVGSEPELFEVTRVVERGRGLDYAILEVAGNPGDIYGFASLTGRSISRGETLVIIQHPQGTPKKVEVGTLSRVSGSRLSYSGLDTLGGSSGSGVLDTDGNIVGVHTNGGCSSFGGANSGVTITAIARASSVI
ncbi:MAG: trypsin-like peptidase domain-containing protein [Pseudobacteriovorax sp.]|nr:trypsin-like peptidase domain-containing protein [Pseudobacteriovorax sp.]